MSCVWPRRRIFHCLEDACVIRNPQETYVSEEAGWEATDVGIVASGVGEPDIVDGRLFGEVLTDPGEVVC